MKIMFDDTVYTFKAEYITPDLDCYSSDDYEVIIDELRWVFQSDLGLEVLDIDCDVNGIMVSVLGQDSLPGVELSHVVIGGWKLISTT